MHTLEELRNGQLTQVTRLQLAAGLTEFPREIFDLADTLEILDLSNNALSELPADLARLSKLKILFCSNNRFESLPEVLGECPSLEMIGFKSNQITHVPESSLPLQTRWLILTDNQIASLPDNMGDLSRLQKLALAGNQLTQLPESIGRCQNLELLRISANQLREFPYILLGLPRLAWLAFSGNPFCSTTSQQLAIPLLPTTAIEWHEILGQGASGVISRATLSNNVHDFPEQVAVKVFKGEVTSDGFPQDELDACLSVGQHDNLVQPLAKIDEAECSALVMSLIPTSYSNLGQPPNLDTCTRDTFTQGQAFSINTIDHIMQQMDSVVAHLKNRHIAHGDLYAHNILINPQGHIYFGDFGAASKYDNLPLYQQHGIQRIEQRAMTALLQDLLGLCLEEDKTSPLFYELQRRMFNIK